MKRREHKQSTLPAKYQKGFLNRLDGRIELARELRFAYAELTDDLGGIDTLSHVKRALAERFIWLEAILRGIERKIADLNGDDAEESGKLLSRWIQATNGLTGLARTLGIERQPRKIEDVREYAKRRAEE